MSKYYIVNNKPDDYGNCKKELVETTQKNAKEYYNFVPVPTEDVPILAKYLWIVKADEEKERTSSERFYGTE
jgi:hypothetical protein